MKKILLLATLLATSLVSAQEKSLDRLWNPYIGAAYSIGNTTYETYKDNTYFAVEAGVTRGNLGLFGSVGRGTTSGAFASNDKLNQYWVEVGATVSQSVGMVDVYGVLGVGTYIQSDAAFIEYGAGFSYPLNGTMSIGGKATNWDGAWYVSPTVSFQL